MRKSLVPLHIILWCLICPPVFAQTTVIRAGHLIDPATGTVTDDQLIRIEQGKIVKVGADLGRFDADVTIDLSDSWIMPGLMDAHVHLTANNPPNTSFELAYLKESSGFRALRGLRNARLVLEAGFTTVKDIGNDANYASADIRKAIDRGWFVGPTMLYTGKIIAPFGGQSNGIAPEQGLFWQYEYIDADSPEEIRKAVRQNIYYGANAIKLVADNSVYYYSEEEIRAAVTEAHRAGMTVTVHVLGGDAARNVILGGADAIEHGFALSDELLTLMKERGTVLVGTDFPFEHLAAILPDQDLARSWSEMLLYRLNRAHSIGVKMAFGSDVVVDLPGMNRAQMALDYLRIWRAAGIPHAKILKCMTTNAAELFGIQQERGAIATGQWADIIATPRNPLDDIQALKGVHFVMKEGTVIRRPRT